MTNFWKLAFETLARMHGYPVPKRGLPERQREWSEPRCYELLFLPAPPRQLLLPAPPEEISIGSFVRFKNSFTGIRGSFDWQHWARQYGNGVGIVRKIHIWREDEPTALVDFPHRSECHRVSDLEIARNVERAMAMLKHGPMYGPRLRLRSHAGQPSR